MNPNARTESPRKRHRRDTMLDADILLALLSQRTRQTEAVRAAQDSPEARSIAAAKLRETESLISAIQQDGTLPA